MRFHSFALAGAVLAALWALAGCGDDGDDEIATEVGAACEEAQADFATATEGMCLREDTKAYERAFRDVLLAVDEHRAARLEVANDVDVVDDLVPNVDRRPVRLEELLDDVDRADHTCAEAARRRDENTPAHTITVSNPSRWASHRYGARARAPRPQRRARRTPVGHGARPRGSGVAR